MERTNAFLQELYLQEKSENTIKNYNSVLNRLSRFMDGKELNKVNMISYKKDLEKSYPMNTVNHHVILINKYLKYIEREDLVLKKEKIQKQGTLSEDKVLTKKEYSRLMDGVKKKDYTFYLLVKTLSKTGIRIGELKFINYQNVSESAYIEVTNKKKTRTIIVPVKLRRELLRYCEKKDIKNSIFCDSGGNPLEYKVIWKLMKFWFKVFHIKHTKAHPHIFRHYFALRYLENGGNISDLSNILGHSDINTTMIYSNTSLKQLKSTMESMKDW